MSVQKVRQELGIKVDAGTFVLSASVMPTTSIGWMASSFVHEGTHLIRSDVRGTPGAEGAAYYAQYQVAVPFKLKEGEIDFLKKKCGWLCDQ